MMSLSGGSAFIHLNHRPIIGKSVTILSGLGSSSVSSFSQRQTSKSKPLLPAIQKRKASKLSDGAGSFLMSFLLYDDPDYTRPMRTNPNLDKESAFKGTNAAPLGCCNIHSIFFFW